MFRKFFVFLFLGVTACGPKVIDSMSNAIFVTSTKRAESSPASNFRVVCEGGNYSKEFMGEISGDLQEKIVSISKYFHLDKEIPFFSIHVIHQKPFESLRRSYNPRYSENKLQKIKVFARGPEDISSSFNRWDVFMVNFAGDNSFGLVLNVVIKVAEYRAHGGNFITDDEALLVMKDIFPSETENSDKLLAGLN